MHDLPDTNESLIARVKDPRDAAAWSEFLWQGAPYFVMPYTRGLSLQKRLERVATFVTSPEGHNQLRVRRERGASVLIRPGDVSDTVLLPLAELVTSVEYEIGEQTREIRTRQPFNYLLAMRPESGPVTWAAYRSPKMPTQLPRGREVGEARSDADRSDGASPDRADRLTAESEELLKLAQGTWERQVTESADPTERMVKEIKGNTEVFSIYKGDTLTYQQVVDFDIDVRDGVAVFTMRNMRVTAGPQKGHEGSGQFSYKFQIRDDKWIEAQGLMNDDGAAPKLSIYERVNSRSGNPGYSSNSSTAPAPTTPTSDQSDAEAAK